MFDFEEDPKNENFRRQIEASNAYHQKKLKSPDEVSKRLNYQDKSRGDPNSPFKGIGRRVGDLHTHQAPPPQPKQQLHQYPKKQNINTNPNQKAKKVPTSSQHTSHPAPRPPPPSTTHASHKTETNQSQFKGGGHFVGSTKSTVNKNQPNNLLAPQKSVYRNQQGVEMRTWQNILNDTMDDRQEKCLSLINETRARNNKPPLAFSRACTQREQEQVEKVLNKEISIENFKEGIQNRADQIPRCKKANEVFALISKSEAQKLHQNGKQEITGKNSPSEVKFRGGAKPLITVKNASNVKPISPVKSTSTAKYTSGSKTVSTAKTSQYSQKKTAVMRPKAFDPVNSVFEKWMEKPAMRTTLLGNYQVIGIVFADVDEGSSMIGAAILANIS